LVTLNQPSAVIYVPVDIFENNTFAVRQMLFTNMKSPKTVLGSGYSDVE